MKDCRKVLEAGYPTIFMPAEYFYFDMRQSKYEAGSNWSNIFDAKHTYSFDFADHGFTAEQVAPFFRECIDLPNVYLPESFWRVLRNKGFIK
jgi:hexosaminidase